MELFENEEFVPIKGFENYEISRSGKVWSKFTGKILKNVVDADGYLNVTLCAMSRKNMRIHRLVALHFIPNPNNYPQINHKDGNKLNNSVENLEWCTCRHNIRHSFDTGLNFGRKGEKNYMAKLTERQVVDIKKKIMQGLRVGDIAEDYNIGVYIVSKIKHGKLWSHVTI